MKNNLYLAIDIGASKIRLGVIDSIGEIYSAKTITTNVADPKKSFELLSSEIEPLKKRFRLSACGVGSPGPLDLKKGIIVLAPNMDKWNGLNLIDEFKRLTRLPVFLDRDGNNALRGERWLGQLRGIKNGLMLTWGSGVGGSVMIDGQIFYGTQGLAGELGHIIVNSDGSDCPLGHKGCLESFIGGKAIEKKYGFTLAEICQQARDKKSSALQIVDQISCYLGQAIETYIQIFDPQRIVIGGAVSHSANIFIKNFNTDLISVSALGSDAGIFGSAVLAMENKR